MNSNSSCRPIIEIGKYIGTFYIKSQNVTSLGVVTNNVKTLDDIEKFATQKVNFEGNEDYKIFYACVRNFCTYAKKAGGDLVQIQNCSSGFCIYLSFDTVEKLISFSRLHESIVEAVMMKKA